MTMTLHTVAKIVAISSRFPCTEITGVVGKVITIVVESVRIMDTIVGTSIYVIGFGYSIVEERTVCIVEIDTEGQ